MTSSPSCFLWKACSLSAASRVEFVYDGSEEGSFEGLSRKLCGLVGAKIAAWPGRSFGGSVAFCLLVD
jgi:hypothetical protein